MPKQAFVALGSNTTVQTGSGRLYGLNMQGIAGATAYAVDSTSIGVTPNYVTQVSNTSNLLVAGPAVAGVQPTEQAFGAPFSRGLTVAATSNAAVTVYYDD